MIPEALQRFFREQNVGRERLVVAVSGGIDSTALLLALRELGGFALVVAHVNHHLRGAESNADEAFVKSLGGASEVRDVPTMTLDDILASEGITKIDLLSVDIELHEPQALRGFHIERYQPSLVCIEGLLPVRQQILDYFAAHGYVLIAKYMWVDLENMYFERLTARAATVGQPLRPSAK